jgi:hypothetical protein
MTENPPALSRLERGYVVGLSVAGLALLLLAFVKVPVELPAGGRYIGVALLTFFCEYINSSLGMGYGTILTPALFLAGLDVAIIVPCVWFSELVAGAFGATLHHRWGNVDFSKGTPARRALLILSLCALAGSVAAVLILVKIPKNVLNVYVGVMITLVGLYTLFKRSKEKATWSPFRLTLLGGVAAFNKSLSGGGCGPLLTGGQVMLGVPGRSAVGITLATKSLICIISLTIFLAVGKSLDLSVAIPACIGASCAVPFAARSVAKMRESFLQSVIGWSTLFLGVLMVLRLGAG